MSPSSPSWPRHPTVYEIDTWVWLQALAERLGDPVTLGSVPTAEWDALAAWGFDAVWLMGVWERSPAGLAIAQRNPDLLESFRRALPDFQERDNVGSPYCVRRYVVDEHLGGREGLATARRELARRGMRLILDFVPNHTAPDHPWVLEHPEYFLRGSAEDARSDPGSYLELGGRVFACGRDPYFPAWPDVVQLNAFEPAQRRAALATVSHIAGQCDAVRCDMAMLLMNSTFERTWGGRAGPRPSTEYWPGLIAAVKGEYPGFRFAAEAYWDLEWELQQQGFDFCYDKRLYDRLEEGSAESIRLHLCAEMGYQERLVRFIENHDEPRASAAFPPEKHRAAAVAMATLPGARLFHEGQLEGRKIRLPVFLGRRPPEPPDAGLKAFYDRLLRTVRTPLLKDGHWSLRECTGWPDNPGHRRLLAWAWEKNGDRCLIVVNFSDTAAQARIPWDGWGGKTCRLVDALSGEVFMRNGDEMRDPGLFVELPPWGCHILQP